MTNINHTRHGGFSLIELTMAIAVAGLLSAIAYPSYLEYVRKANRADGKTAIMDAANRLERYYSDNTTFDAFSIDTTSPQSHYTLALAVAASGDAFTITATPGFTDSDCGNLTLTSEGVKGITGSADVDTCW